MASRLIREGTANQVKQAPGDHGTLRTLVQGDPLYPSVLLSRLAGDAPAPLFMRGDQDLLAQHKIALFCSARCPGDAILSAYDQAARWRDEGRCVISGFHSPVEKEYLRILLRGRQPIVICPARNIENMRIYRDWRIGIEACRLLLLSPFSSSDRRVTAALAEARNEFVAALGDEACLVHASPGGRLSRLAEKIRSWGIPFQGLGLGNRRSRIARVIGTEAASEGLNLQRLGSLINLDLPWNPTRLEQRKGRIQRIGQLRSEVLIYNMRYRGSTVFFS